MADPVSPRARARARRRRRRVIVAAGAIVVVGAGAGTAWAMRGGDGPAYRLSTVTTGTVSQTVDADGTLAASGTRALAFASAGTVTGVHVTVGSTVHAGQTLATIDAADLKNAVTDANTALLQAEQKLADDEDTQATQATETADVTTTGSNSSTGVVTEDESSVRLLAAPAPTATPTATPSATPSGTPSTAPSGAPTAGHGGTSSSTTVADVERAQDAVVTAQQHLDDAIAAVDAAVGTGPSPAKASLVVACAASGETTPSTYPTTLGANDTTITGSPGAAATNVTLLQGGNFVSTQNVAAGGSYSFTGLTSGATYTVSIVRTAQVNTADCTAAVAAVQSAQKGVDNAATALQSAIANLSDAISKLTTSTGGGSQPTGGSQPSGGGQPSSGASGGTRPTGGSGQSGSARPTGGAQPSGGTRPTGASGQSGSARPTGTSSTSGSQSGQAGGSGSGQSGTTAVTITAEAIAADAKAIDAAKAELLVAQAAVGTATLTSPMAGTVAAVAIAKGDSVSANSTSSTITVVGTGTLSVTVDIGLADIDLIKVGQDVRVTVDGRTAPLPAKVTNVSMSNSSSSTGSSSTYPVTVQLAKRYATLYDGMGAAVAIEVGTAHNVLTVPISAVHTTGTLHTVTVYKGGKAAATAVTIGLVGDSSVQVRSGLTAGTRIVLADLGAAVPSSGTTDNRRGTGSSLTSGLSGTSGGVGGGFGSGGFARPGR